MAPCQNLGFQLVGPSGFGGWHGRHQLASVFFFLLSFLFFWTCRSKSTHFVGRCSHQVSDFEPPRRERAVLPRPVFARSAGPSEAAGEKAYEEDHSDEIAMNDPNFTKLKRLGRFLLFFLLSALGLGLI